MSRLKVQFIALPSSGNARLGSASEKGVLASLGALLRDADEVRQSDASQDVYIMSDHVCMQCFMPKPAMLLTGL